MKTTQLSRSHFYAAADPAGRFNNDNAGDDDHRPVGEPGADLENGIVEKDRIKDFSAKQGDRVELPNGAASVASEQHVHGGWELTLEGDGDTILVLGVRDVKHDGSVLDDLGLL